MPLLAAAVVVAVATAVAAVASGGERAVRSSVGWPAARLAGAWSALGGWREGFRGVSGVSSYAASFGGGDDGALFSFFLFLPGRVPLQPAWLAGQVFFFIILSYSFGVVLGERLRPLPWLLSSRPDDSQEFPLFGRRDFRERERRQENLLLRLFCEECTLGCAALSSRLVFARCTLIFAPSPLLATV